MKFIVISAMLCLLSSTVLSYECFTRRGCADDSNRVKSNGDFWNDISVDKPTCTMCICGQTKIYTNSCIVLDDDVTENSLKKSGLLERIKVDPKLTQNQTKDEFVIRDEEVELSEEEAIGYQCKDKPELIFDPKTESFRHPPLKYVHYYYVDSLSYCCTNSLSPSVVGPSCQVKFNNRCQAKIVQKKNQSRFCGIGGLLGDFSDKKSGI